MANHQTNTEFVTHLMEFSPSGPMTQLFVMDALEKWSNIIVNEGIESLTEKMGDQALINPRAWYDAAVDVKTAIDDHYDIKGA